MVILERVRVGLEYKMLDVDVSLLQQIPVVAVDANEKLRAEVFQVFQALCHALRLVSPFVAGARDEMEPIPWSEMRENRAPEDNIVFVLHVNRGPAAKHLCVQHKTFGRVKIVAIFIGSRWKHDARGGLRDH